MPPQPWAFGCNPVGIKWCNARSQKENLTPCYTVGGLIHKTGYSDAVICDWSVNGYRLPTEAEWEKAARGGVTGKNFPSGMDTISHSQANYYASSGSVYSYYDLSAAVSDYHPTYKVGGFPYSSPGGSFAPNGYGLYDMAGNMLESYWDWSTNYTAGSQTDPRGAASGQLRAIRGGYYGSDWIACRVADRRMNNPGNAATAIGFRVGRSFILLAQQQRCDEQGEGGNPHWPE